MKYADRIALTRKLQPGRRRDILEAKARHNWLTVARVWNDAAHQWIPTGQTRVDPKRKARKKLAIEAQAGRRYFAKKWNPNRGPRVTAAQRDEVKARWEEFKTVMANIPRLST